MAGSAGGGNWRSSELQRARASVDMEYKERLVAAAEFILSGDCEEQGDSPPNPENFGVTANLKPHQVQGVLWLIRRYKVGVNVILGIFYLFSSVKSFILLRLNSIGAFFCAGDEVSLLSCFRFWEVDAGLTCIRVPKSSDWFSIHDMITNLLLL